MYLGTLHTWLILIEEVEGGLIFFCNEESAWLDEHLSRRKEAGRIKKAQPKEGGRGGGKAAGRRRQWGNRPWDECIFSPCRPTNQTPSFLLLLFDALLRPEVMPDPQRRLWKRERGPVLHVNLNARMTSAGGQKVQEDWPKLQLGGDPPLLRTEHSKAIVVLNIIRRSITGKMRRQNGTE